jgi:bacillithiol biosynthesis cysteine-adding enzyme BshC
MTIKIDPRLIYSENVLFLDYVSQRESVLRLFEQTPSGFEASAAARGRRVFPRQALSEALRAYNEQLGASAASLSNIAALADRSTLCVIGGQQAGFLGGPAYTLYKILAVIRTAATLETDLGVRVIPIFWLATEDHDFTEINRVRLIEADGSIRTVAFDWSERGLPIELLPITPELRRAVDEALGRIPEEAQDVRRLFSAEVDDDYSAWHARIWSRLFADDGLVLVEPRTVRPLAGEFFHAALSRADEIAAAVRDGADAVHESGQALPLDPERVGRVFHIDPSGRRGRIDDPAPHVDAALATPGAYSTGVALRPILADSLFPTVASVLGPSEIAYHAMLLPLYRLLEVPQPVLVPRCGYTLLSGEQAELLKRLDVPIETALSAEFDPKAVLSKASSPKIGAAFTDARRRVEDDLRELLPPLTELDPGLEARWRQTASHAGQAIDRLEERAVRADLARRGLSSKGLQALITSLRPTGKPQERALSFVHFATRFGVEWIRHLPGPERPDRFAHYVVTIQGGK